MFRGLSELTVSGDSAPGPQFSYGGATPGAPCNRECEITDLMGVNSRARRRIF